MIKNRKGFSLIELSIVLVIIGLLVAGITGGASLIKSAELRSLMSDIRNYQTALNAYYTATGDLPGTDASKMEFTDSCKAWAALVNEGIVDAKLADFSSDAANAGKWTCSAIGSSETLTDKNSVKAKLKGAYYALGFNDDMNQNVIFVTASGNTPNELKSAKSPSTTKVAKASISDKDAKFIDDKMDNGVIDSGKIYSFSAEDGGSTCTYDDSTAKNCAIAISFGL